MADRHSIRPRPQQSVYLIVAGEGPYKIGRSNGLRARLGGLQDGSPVELRVLHEVPTPHAVWLERHLHATYLHRRVRGEWFALSPDEVARICGLCPGEAERLWQAFAPPDTTGAKRRQPPSADFAKALRAVMVTAGMAASDLSRLSAVRQQTISKLLRGERQPSWRIVCKLAVALGVTPNDFLPGR